MAHDYETVVIGAGAVGLAIAYALSLQGREITVLERHARIGSEVSARSSEVIHAGLYYAPGSLKARLCVAGRRQIYDFAGQNGVAVRCTGKLVVAADDREAAILRTIVETARANGAGEVRMLSRDEARALEPELACAAALSSPETGVIDCHAFMQALEGHITSHGGAIVLNARVSGLAHIAGCGFAIETLSGSETARLTCKSMVIAAGLGASQLGRMHGNRAGYRVPETFFAKGHYFALRSAPPFKRLIYPVPDGGGLGVHLTLDIAGRAKFGPDIEWREGADTAFEDADGARRAAFERAIRRYWPGLPDEALDPAYTGVRPKLTRAGEPAADFAMHGEKEHGIAGLVALYGIESPGLTASLAIGKHVAELV